VTLQNNILLTSKFWLLTYISLFPFPTSPIKLKLGLCKQTG
jgi:hypothetical protein